MGRYEEACAAHRWEVPERYNIAQDVCDKHPREKLAMVFESFTGERRDVAWGELQDRSNQIANVLRERGVEVGDRVAMVLAPGPDTAAAFFAVWKCGAILLSMSVLYGDEGIRHRLSDSEPRLLLTDAENAGRFEDAVVLDDALLDGAATTFDTTDTAADDP
ncbi:MAG: AMP-dependent synthetase and ligase, partial [Solirubrobacterales bacterium]|nr:AMP-dependent synthetase and ligase [Solirubrobacterales bacterium]